MEARGRGVHPVLWHCRHRVSPGRSVCREVAYEEGRHLSGNLRCSGCLPTVPCREDAEVTGGGRRAGMVPIRRKNPIERSRGMFAFLFRSVLYSASSGMFLWVTDLEPSVLWPDFNRGG